MKFLKVALAVIALVASVSAGEAEDGNMSGSEDIGSVADEVCAMSSSVCSSSSQVLGLDNYFTGMPGSKNTYFGRGEPGSNDQAIYTTLTSSAGDQGDRGPRGDRGFTGL